MTNGKLVALLGPNEAGKSSLLYAISLLGNDSAPAPGDFSRGDDPANFVVEGRYFLSPEDIQAAGLTTSQWLTVVKRSDGVRRYRIEPPPPQRDAKPRQRLADALAAARDHKRFGPRVAPLGVFDDLSDISQTLQSEAEDLDPAAIQSQH